MLNGFTIGVEIAPSICPMGGDTSPEQQYSLRWNDFHSSILSSFRHLRDEEDFVDVTLACDGCSFTAHKVVLSACSPYFRRLLKANPCQHPIVILRDVQQKDMESLLRYCIKLFFFLISNFASVDDIAALFIIAYRL